MVPWPLSSGHQEVLTPWFKFCVFTVMAETAHSIDGSVYCGLATDEAQKIAGADTASFCISYVSTVITLPVGRSL